jgi:hypothetical protein
MNDATNRHRQRSEGTAKSLLSGAFTIAAIGSRPDVAGVEPGRDRANTVTTATATLHAKINSPPVEGPGTDTADTAGCDNHVRRTIALTAKQQKTVQQFGGELPAERLPWHDDTPGKCFRRTYTGSTNIEAHLRNTPDQTATSGSTQRTTECFQG